MKTKLATGESYRPTHSIAADFPALQLARTGRLVRFFGRLTFVLLVISLSAMFLVPWRQTARGSGTVAALDPQERPHAVLSPAKGIIEWVQPGLREGSYVEKDALIIRLEPFADDGVQLIQSQIDNVTAKKDIAEMNVEVAEQRVGLQRLSGEDLARSLEQELVAAQKKWEQAKNEVQALQADLLDFQNQRDIAERVAARGLMSQQELVSKQRKAESAKAKLEKAENYVIETNRAYEGKKEQIASKKRDIEIKNQAAVGYKFEAKQKLETIKKELADLERKRGELARNEIRAPRSGTIQQWFGVQGSDIVKEGDQLFVIVPETTDLAVELKVSGNDMPLIKEGDNVRLQFEGWPAVQFVGWPSVAVGTFGGKVNRIFPTDDGKGNFRVLVSPAKTAESDPDWPDDRYLRQGVRANGWVLLNEVPLGYEIWRQLNGFPPTVAEEEPDKDKKKSKVKLPKA